VEERKKIEERYANKMKEIIPNCIARIGAVSSLGGDFKYIYLVPTENKHYGAILFEDKYFSGRSQIFLSKNDGQPQEHPISADMKSVGSLYSFSLNHNPDPDWGVTLYAEEQFNSHGLIKAECKEYLAGSSTGSGECPTSKINWIESTAMGPVGNIDMGGKSPESMKIKGDLLVILMKSGISSYQEIGEYSIKISDDASFLDDDPLINKVPVLGGKLGPVSAVKKMYVISYGTDLTED